MSDAKKRTGALQLGGVPFADLLPPEIALEAKARAQRRGLIAFFIVVLVVVVAAYGGVTFLANQQQSALADSKATGSSLLAKQAGFSELQSVNNKSQSIEKNQIFGTSTEIDWKTYVKNITKALPAGSVLTSADIKSATPISPLPAATGPLESTRIAEIVISATTTNVPDIVQWITALSTLQGYTDSTPTSVTKTGTGYTLAFTMHVDKRALANRFVTAGATK